MATSPNPSRSPPKTPPHRIIEDPVTQHTPPQSASRSQQLQQSPQSSHGEESRSSNRQDGSWKFPTSGQLAYLASLPRPTLSQWAGDTEHEKLSSIVTAQEVPIVPDYETRDGQDDDDEDDDGTKSTATTSLSEVLLSIHRHRTGMYQGREYRRQDTWALGERWQRRIRVVDAGPVPEGK